MKKIFTILLAFAANIGIIYSGVYSGACGDNLQWSLNTTDSLLTITGSGNMYNWSSSESIPWKNHRSYIAYISLPEEINNIGNMAFWYCSNLKTITISSGVTNIGEMAFYACSNLTSVTLSNSISSIGKSAFAWCYRLSSMEIPNSVTEIGDFAFYLIPSITYDGEASGAPWDARCMNGFRDGYMVFSDENKTNLLVCLPNAQGNINIPNSVTDIADYAFYYCENIVSVTIPNSVTDIGENAFHDCKKLESVSLGNNVNNIGVGAFYNCHKLSACNFPRSLKSIGNVAFSGSGLVNIVIPTGVANIGNGAFEWNEKLLSVTIPNTIKTIRSNTFYRCTKMTSVEIEDGVDSIAEYAFFDCYNITSLALPKSISYIGYAAFAGCAGLKSIYNFSAIPQEIKKKDVFKNFDKSKCFLYVPYQSIAIYKETEGWKEFTNILPISGTEIEEKECNIIYWNKEEEVIRNDSITLNMPIAPIIEGFTFLKWIVVGGDLVDGINIQAVYQANVPTSAPAIYTNPANPAQKLIKNGNVYILSNEKTYTIIGQYVK